MKRMTLSTDYSKMEQENAEWIRRYYSYTEKYFEQYGTGNAWAALASGADSPCIFVGFKKDDSFEIEKEVLIPLTKKEFKQFVTMVEAEEPCEEEDTNGGF